MCPYAVFLAYLETNSNTIFIVKLKLILKPIKNVIELGSKWAKKTHAGGQKSQSLPPMEKFLPFIFSDTKKGQT